MSLYKSVAESSTMSLFNCIFLIIFLTLCIDTFTSGEIASRSQRLQQVLHNDDYFKMLPVKVDEKVNIQLYYETFCPDCRQFDSTQFKQVVVQLNKYLIIQTYPYGNAETFEHDGKYNFKCQHGPGECYGNKLHACALSIVQNHTQALMYNSCMMDQSRKNRGSDDNAADECGTSMNIDANPIKTCAKGEWGGKLLKYYGDESKRANFHYVPYILVNGKESDGSNFMRDVCAAYANPPAPCATIV